MESVSQGKSIPKALLDAGHILVNNKFNMKTSSLLKVPGMRLTKSKIKDVIKVIRSLENKGILFKGTTRKIDSQERRLLSFDPLIKAGLLLLKNVPTPLAKSILVPLRLKIEASATDSAV